MTINPRILSTTKPRPSLLDTKPQFAALLDVNQPGKVVRPAPHREYREHDGIVKAKHLRPGQVVRAFLQGQPRGQERTVEAISKLGDGSKVLIAWSSGQEPAEYKAAYRWFDAKLVGTKVSYIVPGFEVVR